MPQLIDVPGVGQVEFPDGMNDAQIVAAIRKNSMMPKGPNPTADMSGTDKFLAGAGKAMNDVGLGVQQLAAKVGIGNPDQVQAKIDESRRLDAPLMNTGAGMAGNVVGNVATMIPAALVPGAGTLAGATLLGAGQGAIQPVATGESRASNTGLGAAGGAVGYGIGKVAGKLITPVENTLTATQSKNISRAKAMGAQTTPGVETGSPALKGIEAGMESFPFTSGPMKAIKGQNQTLLNRSAAKAIGENADELSDQVFSAARSRIGSVFDQVRDMPQIPIGEDVAAKLAAIESKYSGQLSKPLSSNEIVGDILGKLGRQRTVFKPEARSGAITGAEYADWQSQLGKISRSMFKGERSDPSLGFALAEVKDVLDDAAAAAMSGPQKEAFNAARQQWRNLVMLETGNVTNEQTGNVGGRLLSNVLARKDKTGFRLGGNTSDMYNMARFSKATPEIVGDSGTATRSALPWMLGSGMLGGAGTLAAGGDPSAAAGAALAPLAAGVLARGGQAAYLSPLVRAYLQNHAMSPAMQGILSQGAGLVGASVAQQKR